MPGKNGERRKRVRVPVREDVYAAFRNDGYKVGLVKDISVDGLAFEFIDDEGVALRKGEVDIFVSGRKFYIKRVPCRIIYKKHLPRDPMIVPLASFVMSRCGVRFDDIDPGQKTALTQLMQAHM